MSYGNYILILKNPMLSTIMEIVQVPSIKYCTAFIFKTILFTVFVMLFCLCF